MLRTLQTMVVGFSVVALIACTAGEDTEQNLTDGGAVAAGGAESAGDGANGPSLSAPSFPAETTHRIPADTILTFAIGSQISTETSTSGDGFMATLTEPVVVNGVTVLPANSSASGVVRSADRSGRVQGVARIELVINQVEANGTTYDLSTAPFVAQANTERGEDAARVGAGAGIGAAIGAALGGGDGAALGAAIGGGAGTAVVLTDRGDEIVIPAGTPINFALDEALTVTLAN